MIHESAWKHLNSIESGSLSVVGVNVNNIVDEIPIEGQILDADLAVKQVDFLNSIRSSRNEDIAMKRSGKIVQGL